MDRIPLGLLPKDVHRKKRFNDICSAIVRYYNANMPIPITWIEEYNDLIENGYVTEIKKDLLKCQGQESQHR